MADQNSEDDRLVPQIDEETDVEIRELYQKNIEHRLSLVDGEKRSQCMPRSTSLELHNESQHSVSIICTPLNQSIDTSLVCGSQHAIRTEDRMGSVENLGSPVVCFSTPEQRGKDVHVSIGCQPENEPSPVIAQGSHQNSGPMISSLKNPTLSPESLRNLERGQVLENGVICAGSCSCNELDMNGSENESLNPNTQGSENAQELQTPRIAIDLQEDGISNCAALVQNDAPIQWQEAYGMSISPQMFFPNGLQSVPQQLIESPGNLSLLYDGPGYGHGVGVNVDVDAEMLQQNQINQFMALQQLEQGGGMISVPTPVPLPSPYVEDVVIPQAMGYRIPVYGCVNEPIRQNMDQHGGKINFGRLPYVDMVPAFSYPLLQPIATHPYPLLLPAPPLENYYTMGNIPAGFTNVTAEVHHILSIGTNNASLPTINEEVELSSPVPGNSANGAQGSPPNDGNRGNDLNKIPRLSNGPNEDATLEAPTSRESSNNKEEEVKNNKENNGADVNNNNAEQTDAKGSHNEVPEWFKNYHLRCASKIPTKFRVQNDDIPDCDRDTKLNIVSFTISTEKVLCDRSLEEFVLSPEFVHKGVIWSCLVYPLGLDMSGIYVDVKVQIKSYKIDERRSLKFKVILMHPEGDGDSYCQKQTGAYRLFDRNQLCNNYYSEDDDCLALRTFHCREYLKLMFKQTTEMRFKIELYDSRELDNKDRLPKFFHWVHSELAHDSAKDAFQQHAVEVLGLAKPLGKVSQKTVDDYMEVQKEMQSWRSAEEKFRKLPYEYYKLAQHYTTQFRLHELSTSSFQVSLYVEKIVKQILEDSERRMKVNRQYYDQNLRIIESRS